MNPLALSRSRHGVLVECLERQAEPVARSSRFILYGLGSRQETALCPNDVVVVHDFSPAQIDNNIGYYVANELLPLFRGSRFADEAEGYAYSEQDIFERYVGEIVRSIDGNERRAWHLYYDNTLAALRRVPPEWSDAMVPPAAAQQDFIGDFGAIYRRAIDLIAELPGATVLDVATCFGFLPLLLATERRGQRDDPGDIVGCDLNPALVGLADDYARHRRLRNVRFVRADILAVDVGRELAPSPARFDVVTALHLLEHLEPEQTGAAVANLWRLAARRLIVAVPLEETPDPRFGHRQVFDRERLLAVGRALGGRQDYFDFHGGWLVVDRRDRVSPSEPASTTTTD
ncbi:MAG: class I SAM-dependent methyltransferase [Candidatus Competibacter sp.]|nr:class I SAM-dependent methyltransferase [Candidatus Competibacter sp.]